MCTFFNSKNRVLGEITGLTPAMIKELKRFELLPRGSALATTSGNLAPEIPLIVHAATGTMDFYTVPEPYYEPSLDSVEDAIRACFDLGKINHVKRMAVPFIGGKIFKGRIFAGRGFTKEEQNEALVASIVQSTLASAKTTGLDFCFVAFDDEAHALFVHDLNTNHGGVDISSHLVKGDIVNFNLHNCDAIVNAANMEVKFGGGISGAIASGTQKQTAIDAEAKVAIVQFWADYEAED